MGLMNKYFHSLGVTSVLLASQLALGNAQVALVKRCEQDSLSVEQANGRLEWAIKCSLENGGMFAGQSTNTYNGQWYDVDYSTGTTVKRELPEYPTFSTPDISASWIAPTNKSAPCNVPAGYTVTGYCRSSCYTPDQNILFAQGEEEIRQAYNYSIDGVMVVGSDSTQDSVQLVPEMVDTYVRSQKDMKHPILTFATEAGRPLKVTPNHPVLDGMGRVRVAETMNVGESMLMENGEKAKIIDIKKGEYYGKVYNIQPVLRSTDSDGERAFDLKNQVVVAQGYLVGSDWFQNSGSQHTDRVVWRSLISLEDM